MFSNTRRSFADLAWQAPRYWQDEFGNSTTPAYWYDPNTSEALQLSQWLNPEHYALAGRGEQAGIDFLSYLDRSYGTGWSDGLDAYMTQAKLAHDATYGSGEFGGGQGGNFHIANALQNYLTSIGLGGDENVQAWGQARGATVDYLHQRSEAERANASSFLETALPALGIVAAPLLGELALAYGLSAPAASGLAMNAATFGAPAEAKFLSGIYGFGTNYLGDVDADAGLGGAFAKNGGSMDMGQGGDTFSNIEKINQNTGMGSMGLEDGPLADWTPELIKEYGLEGSWEAKQIAAAEANSAALAPELLSGFDQVGDLGRQGYDDMMREVYDGTGSGLDVDWRMVTDALDLIRQGFNIFGQSEAPQGNGYVPEVGDDGGISNASAMFRPARGRGMPNNGTGLTTFNRGDVGLYIP